MKGFLYGQTEFNMLQNTIHLNDYINTAKQEGFTFLSITDYNLYGCYKFYQACLKNGIKPIIGMEFCYVDEDNEDSYMLAYALNNKGYKELLKLSTYLNTNEKTLGLDFLGDLNINNLAFITVYNKSIIERYFKARAFSEVDRVLTQLAKLPNYYLGYSFTNRLDMLDSNQKIKEYCSDKIKTLPLHQCCYLTNKDSICYEALTAIGGKNIELSDFDDYSFDLNPIITDELKEFINKINLNLFTDKLMLPKYPKTKGATSFEYLKALCYKGLEKRLNNKRSMTYLKRLDYELLVINKMGFNDYFLIVWDFILYAKKHDILVGPGRGSAAGSLVAYCLGITDIDPIKHGLLFERFLNPERITMPDIDTDFPDDKRDEVIQYVKSLYGEKHVCNISAYSTFLFKSSIRDLGRVMKIESSRLDEIIRLVEQTNDYDKLLEEFKERKDVYNLLYIVKHLENLPRHISTHAAGIIISSIELDDIIPLQKGINDLFQSQYEASDLESIGLLKMDFLGIRNLAIVKNVIDKIPSMDISKLKNIPLNDPMTFKLLQNADTLGIFQLESSGIRKVLLNLKPENFDDLVAVLALYRPGPMDNIDEFVARRHGKPFSYLHPVLEPILKGTYGIIVYQEQIMQISNVVAGFSLGEADLLRRAVSKKNEDKLISLKEKFITGALKRGFDSKMANEIYNYILKFANYGFNKSHSVAYGLLSYQMTYLKAHYFNVFMSNILNNVIGSTDTMISYIRYAKKYGVATFKPNINISTTIFEVTKVGLFMPLQAIHSIGYQTANQIILERNQNGLFKDFKDFKVRCNFIGVSTLEALIYAGALDIFGLTKKQMIDSKESYNDIFAKHLEDQIVDKSEYEFKFLKAKELEYLGYNITYNLFIDYEKKLAYFKASKLGDSNQKYNKVLVCFEQIKQITTKNNQLMLVGVIRDDTSEMDYVIFPNDYERLGQPSRDSLYLVDCKFELDVKINRNKAYIKNFVKAS